MSSKRKPAREPAKPPADRFPSAAVKARTTSQADAIGKFDQFDILFLIGPAGTGKTHIATHLAWRKLSTEQVNSVIITRPMVECGGRPMGFLPGDSREKMHPWVMPFQDVLRSIVGPASAPKVLATFETLPLGHVRGRTFDRAVAILDESQNASIDEIRAYLTRIGEGGKIIVCGDPDQSDIPGGGPHLTMVAEELEKEGAAGVVRFPDTAIVRHPLIARIERVFRKIKGQRK